MLYICLLNRWQLNKSTSGDVNKSARDSGKVLVPNTRPNQWLKDISMWRGCGSIIGRINKDKSLTMWTLQGELPI